MASGKDRTWNAQRARLFGPFFSLAQLRIVSETVQLAEDLTSDHFKISLSQWRRSHYDFKTHADLDPNEVDDRAFAQILRYLGQPHDSDLGSSRYDFYKICIQDHVILRALQRERGIPFPSLMLYIVTHELIHIVRFNRFQGRFEARAEEKVREEKQVHSLTYEILKDVPYPGMMRILDSFHESRTLGGHAVDSW